MTATVDRHIKAMTCVDTSAAMLAGLNRRYGDLATVCADAGDHLARVPRGYYELITSFWALNYPLLSCFETNTGTQIVARDHKDGMQRAERLLSDLTESIAPGGSLLAFFFDDQSPEQRFVTDLWEAVAPFPGTGRGFTRQLLTEHLNSQTGRTTVRHLIGHMLAPDLEHAETWFLDGHLKGFPGLVDNTDVRDTVRRFLERHMTDEHAIRVPAGMYVITHTRP